MKHIKEIITAAGSTLSSFLGVLYIPTLLMVICNIIDYATGLMAAKILEGKASAQDTPYISASAAELYVNTAAAEKIGMTLDDSYVSTAAEMFDTIEA
mgnify:CR=1 FL=1